MQAPLPLSLQASISQTIRGILSNKVEYLPQVWSYKLLYKSFCELSSSAIFCEIIFPEIWNSSVINLFSQTFSPALCCDPGYYNGQVSKLIIPVFFCVLFFSLCSNLSIWPSRQVVPDESRCYIPIFDGLVAVCKVFVVMQEKALLLIKSAARAPPDQML